MSGWSRTWRQSDLTTVVLGGVVVRGATDTPRQVAWASRKVCRLSDVRMVGG